MAALFELRIGGRAGKSVVARRWWKDITLRSRRAVFAPCLCEKAVRWLTELGDIDKAVNELLYQCMSMTSLPCFIECFNTSIDAMPRFDKFGALGSACTDAGAI